jgi:hypothetical protein
MTETPKMNHLIQQHILEHESRLKHMDALLERAQQGASKSKAGDIAEQLASAKAERDKLAGHVEEYKKRPPGQWSESEFENKGPMIVWDTIAQQLEKLVERMEH